MASKICKNCNKEYTGRSNASKYCGLECGVAYLTKTFECKVHGRIDKSLIRFTFPLGNSISPRCLMCKRSDVKKNQISKRKDPAIRCRNCSVEFCRIGHGKALYCTKKCQNSFLKNNPECKHHGVLISGEFEVYTNKFGNNVVVCRKCQSEYAKKPERVLAKKEISARYLNKNYERLKEKLKENSRKHSKKKVEIISLSYAKCRMVSNTGLKAKDIPDELAEIQKLKMLINRKKREILNENS